QAAEANFRIGDLRQRLGRYPEAVAAYRAAIDLYGPPPQDTNTVTTHVKLARAHKELGRALRAMPQYEEAVASHELAIRTLNDGEAGFARRPECRYELARAHFLLGQRDMMQMPGPPGGPRKGPPRGFKGDRPRPPDRGPRGDASIERAAALLEGL